jgi:hypothetical protein
MNTRRAKQIIYGTFYGLVWLAVIAGIYYFFIKPAITPVPCAGPLCGVASVQPIGTSTIKTFTTGSGSATYLAKIANGNTDIGASDLSYSFDFYNASGTLVASIPGSSFIYPNEVKYLLAPNQVAVSAAYSSLDIQSVTWIASSSIGNAPRFTFQNMQAQTASTTIAVSGQVVNNDIPTFNRVLIMVVFKDGSGNAIGASQTEIDNFAPNTTQNFSVIYPALPGINPMNNEIVAYAFRAL